jgi:hypothetical protein
VGATRQGIVSGFVTLTVLLASPQRSEAQVGITSGMAQIALVARVAPRGSIEGVGPQRETARVGSVREASVTVRLVANTGYQLVVRGMASATRVWVRGANGEFQKLSAGSAVTVARDSRGNGPREHQVEYRIEASDVAGNEAPVLPARYEIAINPTM